jgi:hypothetical protein
MNSEQTGPTLLTRVAAIVVLAVAVWILLRLVIGVITAVAWVVAIVVALAGVAWAVSVLRR